MRILRVRFYFRLCGWVYDARGAPPVPLRYRAHTTGMDVADLELTLRRQSDGATTADLSLRAPDSIRDSELALGVPTAISGDDLLTLALDPEGYGRALTAQLFSDPRLREGWIKAMAFAQGASAAVRVRLRIDPSADDLHTLRWETLHDPASDRLLCRSERVLFSRYLDTGDLSRVRQGSRPDLRALAVIANPPELAGFNLAPVNTIAERARIAVAVGGTPLTVLGRDTGGGSASLNNIVAALREGYSILYLVCHGVMADGRPYLWLECDEPGAGPVAGDELLRRIADLPPERRPLMVVLASCQSAGNSHERDALAALGPALARSGVAAVVAMQGSIPIPAIERLMPAFFKALVDDGQIDRALAVARADLPADLPWWMPVLFMQVRDGRVWAPLAAEAAHSAPVRRASDSLTALADLARDAQVRTAVVAFTTDFESACVQIDVLNSYKQLHDLFQQLEDASNVMAQHARRLPGDLTAWEDLEVHDPDVQSLVAELLRVGATASFAGAEGLWMRRLERAGAELSEAFVARDPVTLKRALNRISDVLGRELSRMNSALVTAARTLRLQQLLNALTTIRDQLALNQLNTAAQSQFEIFADGVKAMARLNARLGVLVATHDAFQEVDDELRRVKELLSQDVEELILAWEDIRQLAQRLYEVNPGEWASRLNENSQQLDQAMAANEPTRIRRAFRSFHHQALISFAKVDQDLLSLCTELQQIGRPTEAVLKMLA
jgi:hypothetical protein